jgi:deoxyribodipyrimidine photo-lyase
MASGPLALVWFRDDLRLTDNPALHAAVASKQPLVCVYVLDEESPDARPLGGAARWWLAGSLRALDTSLRRRGGALTLRRGAAGTIIAKLATEIGASAVHGNRRYDAAGVAVDHAVEQQLAERGIGFETHQANLLFEPGAVLSKAGKPMEVFTPFWRTALARGEPRAPLGAPAKINGVALAGDSLAGWHLEPANPDWAGGLRETWTPGEDGAKTRLETFLDATMSGYAQSRDRPDRDGTSRLSPHLRFGEISPFQLWHAARLAQEAPRGARANAADVEKFLAELGWREFCYQLLARNPKLATRNLQRRFDDFAWRSDARALRAWQRGETGYPIVDAGMRQLWRTGWMHNRVRMVVASFLIKHLLLDWREGEAWFWDTLVDADPASNPASWQWVAGSGADAAPFFRIFNPILQGEKFDPQGEYVKQNVPELACMPVDFIHAPWTAPAREHTPGGVGIGATYPEPIVDHAAARARALAAFKRMNRSD